MLLLQFGRVVFSYLALQVTETAELIKIKTQREKETNKIRKKKLVKKKKILQISEFFQKGRVNDTKLPFQVVIFFHESRPHLGRKKMIRRRQLR